MDSLASCFFGALYKYVIGIFPATETSKLILDGKQYQRIKRLGEGGYAFVDLVKDTSQGMDYAMKTVLAQSPTILQAVEQEASIQAQLSHPALLPLHGKHVVTERKSGSAADACTRVHLLFPAYTDGTLAEELEALEQRAQAVQPGGAWQAGRQLSAAAAHSPLATGTMLLSVLDTLSIFHQIASGLASMHEAGYAHRDIKPHNVLIQRLNSNQTCAAAQPLSPALPVSIAMQPPASESSALLRGESMASVHAGGVLQYPPPSPQQPPHIQGSYRVVIMDFGSSCQRYLDLPNRSAAMALQEDAESNCTATFRAPELMSPPSGATVDLGAADVWSLGCTLFALCYGRSPFQVALDRGGSLALAISNGTLPFPTLPPASPMGSGQQQGELLPLPALVPAAVLASLPTQSPAEGQARVPGHLALQALVKLMCVTDPKDRPTAHALAQTAQHMLENHEPERAMSR